MIYHFMKNTNNKSKTNQICGQGNVSRKRIEQFFDA